LWLNLAGTAPPCQNKAKAAFSPSFN